MAEAKYTTRRAMLIEERSSLSQSIADAFGALTALINGKITSYNLGAWSISRSQADLDKLRQWLKDAQARLDEIDNKILSTIIDKFGGGPVGLTTIATAIGEDQGTVEEVYEPFLIMEGFIKRTPRGRQATFLAYKHLGRNCQRSDQSDLFDRQPELFD